MTPQQLEVLRELRHEGYAVIVWTPEEIGLANPRRLEDRSIEFGHEVIFDMGGPTPEDDDYDHVP